MSRPMARPSSCNNVASPSLPFGEFVWGGEVPKSYMTGPYLQAPDWIGIHRI
jgi:hypothetical protein